MEPISKNDELINRVDAIKGHFSDSIIPLHNFGDYKSPFIGTAIYLKIGNSYFIITAYHVLDALSPDLCIPLQTKYTNSIAFVSDTNIKKDFSFAKLSSPLEVFKPIDISLCGKHDSKKKRISIAVGYPETKVEQYKKKIKSVLEILISKESADQDYNDAEADRIYNIVTGFSPYDIIKKDGIKTKLPFPNGMSGGGLFEIVNETTSRNIEPKLVGLLTRWNDKKKRNMISTRIEYILAGIKAKYPDTEIPEDMIKSIKVTNCT